MPSRPKRGASSRTRLSGAVPIAAALLALAAPAAAACARPDSPAASGHAGAGTAAWSERNYLLGQVRWWIAPDSVERLQALAPEAIDTCVQWAVPAGSEDGVTGQERKALQVAKAAALRARPDAEAGLGAAARGDAVQDDPAKADAARSDAVPTEAIEADAAQADTARAGAIRAGAGRADAPYRVVARVTEVWRPWRLLNAFIVALPGPGFPFVTQGGAAVEMELVDTAQSRPVAGFSCRQYAGVSRFAYAFGRIGHATAALQDCAGLFLAMLREGRLPESALAMTPGGAATVVRVAPAAASVAEPGTAAGPYVN